MSRSIQAALLGLAAVSFTTPALAWDCFFWGGGGRGAPGPEMAAGLPFLLAAGAIALLRRRRAAD